MRWAKAAAASYQPSTALDERTAKGITRFLDVNALTESADLAFVFGTRLPEPARLAASLLERGVVPLVVVTGGVFGPDGRSEATRHRDFLLEAGVSPQQILVEDRSTSTLENVTLALPLIEARVGLERVRSVLAVAKWAHSRRALMTLKRHLPGVRLHALTYERPGLEREGWWRDEATARRVLWEWEQLPEYVALGEAAPLERDGDAFV